MANESRFLRLYMLIGEKYKTNKRGDGCLAVTNIRKFLCTYCLTWSCLAVPNWGRILRNYAFYMMWLSIFAPDYYPGAETGIADIDPEL